MGRPAKPVSQLSGAMTKEERQGREVVEQIMQGKSDKLKPPAYLTKDQKKIFKYIKNELDEAHVLGNLDIYVLTQAATIIDRYQKLEHAINMEPDNLLNPKVNALQDKLAKQLFRIYNELSLSPQSRAKLAIKATEAVGEKKKSLLDILAEDDE